MNQLSGLKKIDCLYKKDKRSDSPAKVQIKEVNRYRFGHFAVDRFKTLTIIILLLFVAVPITYGLNVSDSLNFTSGLPKINFNKGGSEIRDDNHLRLNSDDDIYINAPRATYVQNDLQVGDELLLKSSINGATTNSKIFDNGNLRIDTDDYLYLNAPNTVYASNNLEIGNDLRVKSQTLGTYTGSKIFDNGNLRIDTDDDLYLNAPNATYVQGALKIGGGYGSTGATISDAGNIQANGTLTVDGTSTLTGNATVAGTLAVTGVSTLTGALYANGGLDRSTAAALAIGATNATSVTIGSANATSITLTTDGTGNAEVVLPAGSIGTAEILDGTITGSDLASNMAITTTGTAALNGGITVDSSFTVSDNSGDITTTGALDVTGAAILRGGLNMVNTAITNIGAAGTDFLSTGGLTLADAFTVSAGEVVLSNTSNITFTTQTESFSTGPNTVTPTSTFVTLNNTSGGALAIVLSETGARDGQLLIIHVYSGSADVTIADTNGTQETNGNLTLTAGDVVQFIYSSVDSEWVQVSAVQTN